MISNDERFDELIKNARAIFIEELEKRTIAVTEILGDISNDERYEKLGEVLIYFHRLSGTSSTLGLERLSTIGRDNENQIRKVINSGKEMDNGLIENIRQAVEDINRVLETIRTAAHSQNRESNVSGSDYTNMRTQGKILLIDDDVVVLKLLEDSFSIEGYDVYICDDPLSAMDIIEISKPDVILLDIMMPKCDGYEILSGIKANPKYSDICVIFLSAIDNVEDKIRGMKAGVDDYITKPFIAREVVLRTEIVLKLANRFKEKLLRDNLTGAYSRFHFNERMGDELERYKRYHTVFSVAFIDLDNFKITNDTYGHLTGDHVLQKFVSYMDQSLRECDCIFRYGGEEFVILMPDTNEEQAFAAMDRIREKLCSQPIYFGGSTITYSCGIKEVDENDKIVSKLIDCADKAMYAAKSSGKNKVVRYTFINRELKNKKTLLLVDDENTILKLLSSRLSNVGYSIVTAADGMRAIEIIEQTHVDAVILDLMLPDMDGMEICRKIRENPLSKTTRIIILSQKKDNADVIEGLRVGADDYITKPFSMGELEARVMRILSR